MVQAGLPNPAMVDVEKNFRDRTQIYAWIGNHIHGVNALLQAHLIACHNCFHLSERRPMQIYAVPLASLFGLDGFCNISTQVSTLFIDTGRLLPQDWLALVAHEYTHAHLGSPGHHHEFAMILTRLCLGLGLDLPTDLTEAGLQRSPSYCSTLDPLAFWRGETRFAG
jgi:hypothetical protein